MHVRMSVCMCAQACMECVHNASMATSLGVSECALQPIDASHQTSTPHTDLELIHKDVVHLQTLAVGVEEVDQ